jgi:hypothetical protein
MTKLEDYIDIKGRDDEGPWIVKRVVGALETSGIEVSRFGVLCQEVIKLLEGQERVYGVNYRSPNGRIFEDSEQNVIYHIVNTHNKYYKLSKLYKEIIESL